MTALATYDNRRPTDKMIHKLPRIEREVSKQTMVDFKTIATSLGKVNKLYDYTQTLPATNREEKVHSETPSFLKQHFGFKPKAENIFSDRTLSMHRLNLGVHKMNEDIESEAEKRDRDFEFDEFK